MSVEEAARHYQGESGCPDCGGGAGEIVSVGRTHWGYCATHKVKWMIGSNLFTVASSEEEQRARYDAIGMGEFRRHLDEQERAWAEDEDGRYTGGYVGSPSTPAGVPF